MSTEPENLSGSFENSVQEKAQNENTEEKTPSMVEEEQPYPHPRPHGLGEEEVDREIFNQRWQHEVDKHKQADAFDQVDEKANLSQTFGTHARGLERE